MTSLECSSVIKMDFFSDKSLLDALGHLPVEEQKQKLSEFNFSNFLKTHQIRDFLMTYKKIPAMPTMRYVYLYYLFRRIGEFIGESEILDIYEAEAHNFYKLPTVSQVYELCSKFDNTIINKICLVIEKITRGQHENYLWDILRDGIISSSKLLWAVKQQAGVKRLFNPWPIQNNHYVNSPLAFGLRCEDVVKEVVCDLIYKNGEACFGCGFLQSPLDGIFGVSLDLCFGSRKDADNLIVFEPSSTIFEIKCRFKYLFSKEECSLVYQQYKNLYNTPDKQNFIRFINSINRPAVEFLPEGRLPSETDYLLTFDHDWNLKSTKKRKLDCTHFIIQDALAANMHTTSTVFVLTDPAETGGKIDIKGKIKTQLFINPCHSYFYQILLQYKVVSNYISLSSTPNQLGSVKCFIVSAFFRRRHFSDPAECSVADNEPLSLHVEIPVLIILTPVYIPKSVLSDSILRAAKFWSDRSEEELIIAPWVPGALFANGELTP